MTNTVVAFGGNRGPVGRAFATALEGLTHGPGTRVLAVSSLYRSAPVGVADQPAFLNAAALFETVLDAQAFLARLQSLEAAAGRVRQGKERWGPRALDLDLLWFGDEVRSEATLELPHPRIAERTFVLEPLDEVAPAWRHPVTGLTAVEMLAALRAAGQDTVCARLPGARLGEVSDPEEVWA